MSQEDMRIPRPKVTPRPDGQPAANKTLDELREIADAHMNSKKADKIVTGETGVIFDGNQTEEKAQETRKPFRVASTEFTEDGSRWTKNEFKPGIDSQDPNQHLPF